MVDFPATSHGFSSDRTRCFWQGNMNDDAYLGFSSEL